MVPGIKQPGCWVIYFSAPMKITPEPETAMEWTSRVLAQNLTPPGDQSLHGNPETTNRIPQITRNL